MGSRSILLAGESGTGKTRTVRALAESRNGLVLVVNANTEYEGSKYSHLSLEELSKTTFDQQLSCVVIEDLGYPSASVTRTLNKLLTFDRRHHDLSVLLVSHALRGNALAPLIPHFCFIVVTYAAVNKSIFLSLTRTYAKEFQVNSEAIWTDFERGSIGSYIVFCTQTRELQIADNIKELIEMTAKATGSASGPSKNLSSYFRRYFTCESQGERESATILCRYLSDEMNISQYLNEKFNLEFFSDGVRLTCNILDILRACSTNRRIPTKTERLAFRAISVIGSIPKLLIKNAVLRGESPVSSETLPAETVSSEEIVSPENP